MNKALVDCMSSPVLLDLPTIYTKTDGFAKQGLIDSPANIKDSKVFMFSGTKDSTVYPGVSLKGQELYNHYGADVLTEFTLLAAHTQPTDDPKQGACSPAASPYISNCNYNGAFHALNHISSRAPLNEPVQKVVKNLFSYS